MKTAPGTTPQDRRTVAALAYAQAAWELEKARRDLCTLGGVRMRHYTAFDTASLRLDAAEHVWFAMAAEVAP